MNGPLCGEQAVGLAGLAEGFEGFEEFCDAFGLGAFEGAGDVNGGDGCGLFGEHFANGAELFGEVLGPGALDGGAGGDGWCGVGY